MRNATLSLFFLLLMGSLSAQQMPPGAMMQRANEAYRSGEYARAQALYDSLLAHGYRSKALYYNLGNCHYRQRAYGPAVLAYERALLLGPGDRDIRHNLALVRSRLADEIDPLPEFFLRKWWRGLVRLFPPNTWAILAIAGLWIGGAGWLRWQVATTRPARKRGFFAGWIALCLGIFFLLLAYSGRQMREHSGRGVLMQPEAVLRIAPEEASKEILRLHEGTTFLMLDRISDWYKVRLPNGEEGWLPVTAFEAI